MVAFWKHVDATAAVVIAKAGMRACVFVQFHAHQIHASNCREHTCRYIADSIHEDKWLFPPFRHSDQRQRSSHLLRSAPPLAFASEPAVLLRDIPVPLYSTGFPAVWHILVVNCRIVLSECV